MTKVYVCFLFIALGIFACKEIKREIVFPDASWLRLNPEEQGIDKAKMMAALDTLKSYCGEDGLEETLIIRNGFIVYEGDSINKKHGIYSCSKSFTSTVLGLMIDEGKANLEDYAWETDSLLAKDYRGIQLRHFTTMTSGYNAVGSSRWCDGCSEDWSHHPYQPDHPLFEPGQAYCYWDEAQMFLGRVLTQKLRLDMKAYLDEKIMRHIDLGEWDWISEGSYEDIPIRNGCTSVIVNAHQLARMGYLFLNKGNWKGKQLISEQWVEAATRSQVPGNLPIADTDRRSTEGNGRYGYNWWVRGNMGDMIHTPEGTYYMSGFNNNMCFVVPEWKMVLVRLGDDGNPPEGKRFVYDLFFKEMANAIRD